MGVNQQASESEHHSQVDNYCTWVDDFEKRSVKELCMDLKETGSEDKEYAQVWQTDLEEWAWVWARRAPTADLEETDCEVVHRVKVKI